MTLEPDQILHDEYEIINKIGEGGFSTVYKATHLHLGRDWAIKEFNHQSAKDFGDPEEMRERFEKEAKTAHKLQHPHIIDIQNLFPANDTYYIVMPYMPKTLEDELGSLNIAKAIQIMLQICEGLAYAHQHKVIHLDIKPGNILLDDNGKVKITDFGIAHVPQDVVASSYKTTSFHAGTIFYMASEQFGDKFRRDDPRVDVYALGALFYRMLTNRHYLDFDQSGTKQAKDDNIERISNKEPLKESLQKKDVPEALVKIILKALSKNPVDRYDDAAEMLKEIKLADPSNATTKNKFSFKPINIKIVGLVLSGLLILGGVSLISWSLISTHPSGENTPPSEETTSILVSPSPSSPNLPTAIPSSPPSIPALSRCPDGMALISPSAFCLDIHEVTNIEYKQCIEAGICPIPKSFRSLRRKSYYDVAEFQDYPMIQVTWNMAKLYCEQFAKNRLPTVAEWEHAWHGLEDRSYPGGSDPPPDDFYETRDTEPIKSRDWDRTPDGVYDLWGNIREWVDDKEGIRRTLMGSSFLNQPDNSMSYLVEEGTDWDIGFRCASEPN